MRQLFSPSGRPASTLYRADVNNHQLCTARSTVISRLNPTCSTAYGPEPEQTTTSTSARQQQLSRHSNPINILAATRRGTLAGLAAVAASPVIYSNAAWADIAGSMKKEDDEDFYTRWQYARPSDILPYIYENARKGNAASVLRAIEDFSIR